MKRIRIAAGSNNLFDVYPDEWKDWSAGVTGALTTNGNYRYAGGTSPWGFSYPAAGRIILIA